MIKKLHIIITLFIFLILLPAAINGQEMIVSGKATDAATKMALPGVSISVKEEPGKGTITDLNGEFELSVLSGQNLVFSYVGYKTMEVMVKGTDRLNIELEENIQDIAEVVIVGTSMKKSDLTGAVATVSAESLDEIPTGNVNQALQGKIPGVYIQNNPRPGSKASIKIRGNNSLQYGTNPIFVVDGLVIDGGFDNLNPDDIASIEVLKDASATAIYGSRGANGVVVITTRKGTRGGGQIFYDSWFGVQEFTREMPLLGGSDTYDLRVDAYANAYMDRNPTADRERYIERSLTNENPVKNLIFSKEELDAYMNGETYSWLDTIVQKGFQQNHAVGFSGGNDDGNYYISFNYNQQVGQLVQSKYDRYSGKVNLEQQVKPWFKAGTFNTFIITDEKPVVNENMFITALRASPLLPVSGEYWYMREGKIDNQSSSNPLRDLTIDRDIHSNRLMSSSYLQIKPLRELSFRSTFSVDLAQGENYSYYPTTSTQSYKSTYDGQSIQVKSKTMNWQWDNSLTYDRTFDQVHRVSLLLGTNISYYGYNYNQQNANGYNNDLFSYMYSHGASDKENFYLASNFTSYSIMSALARFNYSYDTRYYITFTGRYDGSSRFGPSNKWGFFPSVAGSWNIHREQFMDNVEFISRLKLRLGYGIAGNQNIPNYGYLTLYNPSISLESNILTNSGRYGNPFLRWERQEQLNVGIDISLAENRINMTLDLFNIINEDLLMQRSTAPSSGYLSMLDNIGAMRNRGVEFMVDAAIISARDFSWDLTFNIAADRNRVKRLYGDLEEIYNLGGYSNNEIQREGNIFLGESVNTIYVYEFDRIVQESDMEYVNTLELGSRVVKPGDILPADRDENGIINDLDRYVVGKTDPDFYGGLSTSLVYRNLKFSANINYSVGGRRISYLYETLMGSIGTSAAHADLINRWTPENTDTNIPRAFSEGGRFGLGEVDWTIQDASFLRLSAATLSYTFGNQWFGAGFMKNLTVYVVGNNLITLTKYKGYDPENGDWYPTSRMVGAGLKIGI